MKENNFGHGNYPLHSENTLGKLKKILATRELEFDCLNTLKAKIKQWI